MFPSPKFQEIFVLKEEKSVKVIVLGAHPDVTLVLKKETTLFLLTVIGLLIESLPHAFDTISFMK